MHSADRTLLASLGFADKDRQNPRHTLACEWIASHASMAFLDAANYIPMFGGTIKPDTKITRADGRTEQIIKKGDGKYATVVGFADVVLTVTFDFFDKEDDSTVGAAINVGVEVKIGREDIASIIRQIALYREYAGKDGYGDFAYRWLLAVDWALTETEFKALERERIRAVRLGKEFDAFCDSDAANLAAKVATL